MARYTVKYSDSIEIEADSDEEAISKACDSMFCDGPKDYCFRCSIVESEDDDDEVEDA